MPNTKAAKKALRQSEKRRVENLRQKRELNAILKDFKKTLSSDGIDAAKAKLSGVYKKLDKAAKGNLITKNKASRLKSRLTKKLGGDNQSQASTPAPQPTQEDQTENLEQ